MTPEQTALALYEQFTRDDPTLFAKPGIVHAIGQAIREAVQAERERCVNLVTQFEDHAQIGFPELRMPMANGGTTLEYPGSDDFPF